MGRFDNIPIITSTPKTTNAPKTSRFSNIPIVEVKKDIPLLPQKKEEPKKSLLKRASDVSSKFLQGATDTSIGALKGVGSTLINASQIGEKVFLRPLDKILPGKRITSDKQTSAEKFNLETKVKPTNTAQKVGFFGEQIGEFLIPGSAATKVGRAAEAGTKLGTLLPKATKLGATAITEAGLAAGQTALQEGDINKNVGQAAKYGGVFPVASAAASKAAKGIGKGLFEITGLSTGAGSQAIKEAFENPTVIKYAREAGKKGVDEVMEEALQEAKKGLRIIKNVRSTEYQTQLSKIQLNQKQLDNITNEVRDKAVGLLDEFDIKPVTDAASKKLNNLDFSNSTLVEGSNIVEKAFNDVFGWTDNTPAGLDKLKKRLSSYSKQLTSVDKKPAKYIVDQLTEGISSGLKNNVSGYTEMTQGYRKASELINEIEGALSLGDRKQKETAIRKLLQTVRKDEDSRKALLEAVGKASGVDLTAKVSGTLLSPKLPRGLSGKLLPGVTGVGLGAGFLNPSFWTGLLAYGAVSSPKLIGKIANIAGQLSRLKNTGNVPVQLERLIRQTILELQKQ